MTEAEFEAADVSGTGPTKLSADNNPSTKVLPVITGLKFLTSNKGKLYFWDGAEAFYLKLERTTGTGPSLVNHYAIHPCTQDAAEFAALLND